MKLDELIDRLLKIKSANNARGDYEVEIQMPNQVFKPIASVDNVGVTTSKLHTVSIYVAD